MRGWEEGGKRTKCVCVCYLSLCCIWLQDRVLLGKVNCETDSEFFVHVYGGGWRKRGSRKTLSSLSPSLPLPFLSLSPSPLEPLCSNPFHITKYPTLKLIRHGSVSWPHPLSPPHTQWLPWHHRCRWPEKSIEVKGRWRPLWTLYVASWTHQWRSYGALLTWQKRWAQHNAVINFLDIAWVHCRCIVFMVCTTNVQWSSVMGGSYQVFVRNTFIVNFGLWTWNYSVHYTQQSICPSHCWTG